MIAGFLLALIGHGVIGALLALELAISTVDQVLEVDIRTLPPTERAAHVVLFVNLGIILALLGQQLLAWAALPPALVRVDHGWASWVLSGLAIASLGWRVRDGLAASRLRRRSRMGGNGGL
ncbi:hypothetical protein CR152_01555 [Massilia violaceinigra]|uniref:Uncharacterized protein n=1 Tax=Massilia violaceinigra TaxID=2045208 RepID=A0A2D2DED0_9BURK|nr:hypothetical protein [Massilia violaceinigra]ATQ73336.1 hypothetical protein CR152_01555 [Massilia violaceinigra]